MPSSSTMSKGFTLVEAMIAILILAAIAVALSGMIMNFSTFSAKDVILTCLVQGASSGIEAKRANYSTTSLQLQCANYTVNVSISGTPVATAPAAGSGQSSCVQVVSTASIGSRSKVVTDLVCNLPK